MPRSPLLARIEHDMEARLAELEAERAAIRRALRVLRAGAEHRGRAARGRRLDDAALLAALRAEPGARGSLLALELGAASEHVAERLERLEREGQVERDGLGWRAVAIDEEAVSENHRRLQR